MAMIEERSGDLAGQPDAADGIELLKVSGAETVLGSCVVAPRAHRAERASASTRAAYAECHEITSRRSRTPGDAAARRSPQLDGELKRAERGGARFRRLEAHPESSGNRRPRPGGGHAALVLAPVIWSFHRGTRGKASGGDRHPSAQALESSGVLGDKLAESVPAFPRPMPGAPEGWPSSYDLVQKDGPRDGPVKPRAEILPWIGAGGVLTCGDTVDSRDW
jgi:hypothetical protein